MKPYYEEAGITLYHGDCRDVLPGLSGVDAIVTDPPYGIGFEYDVHIDAADKYGDWIWSIVEKAECLCAPGSPVFVWQAQKNIRELHKWFPREWRLFISARNFTQMNRDKMPHAYEPVVVWWTPGERYVAPSGKGVGVPRDWHIADMAGGMARNKQSGASLHPCPRQEDAMVFVVANWARPGGIVLDMFSGSGTTGVACKLTGRKFVGIELSEAYCEVAAKRLARTAYQPPLYTPEPDAPTRQLALSEGLMN